MALTLALTLDIAAAKIATINSPESPGGICVMMNHGNKESLLLIVTESSVGFCR